MREKTKNKKKTALFFAVYWLVFSVVMLISNSRETMPDWLRIAIQVFLIFSIVMLLAYLFSRFLFRGKEIPAYLNWWFEGFEGTTKREKTLEERYAEMLESEEEDENDELPHKIVTARQ